MKYRFLVAAFALALGLSACAGNSGGTNQSEHMVNGNPAESRALTGPDHTTVNDQVGTLRDTTNQTRVSTDTTGQGTTQRTGPGNNPGGGEPVGATRPSQPDGTRSGNDTRTRNGTSTNGGQ